MAQELDLNTDESTLVEITENEAKRIRQVYKNAAADIQKQLKHLPNAGSKSLQESYLNSLLKQVNRNLDLIDKEIDSSIKSTIQNAAAAYVDKSIDFLKEIGLPIGGAFSHVPDDVVRSIVSGNVYGGNWKLSQAIWNNHMKTQSDVEKVIAQGVAENKSVYDIAKALEKYVDPSAKKDWDWSKVYPGTAKKVDYNAQRLARTLTAHAYQQSFVRSTRKNPFVTEYEWQSSNSARVCEICEERDGQRYPKDSLPLDHPNGMCTFIAVIPDSMEEISNRLGDWVEGVPDEELDNYLKFVYGAAVSLQFSPEQEKWLTPLGYSVDNMPASFSEFAHKLGSSQQDKLLSWAGGSWSDPHPYQIMEKWYNEHLASVKPVVSVPGVSPTSAKNFVEGTIVSPGVPDKSSWISLIQLQTESHMLELEKDSIGSMKSSEKSGIKVYTGSAYQEINSYLRYKQAGLTHEDSVYKSGISDSQYKALQDASKGLKRASTAEDLVLRRGSSIGDLAGLLPGDYQDNKVLLRSKSTQELNDMFSGAVFKYSGFTYTSSLWDRGFSGTVETIFYAPKGTAASSIMSISQFGTGEGETLLNEGTSVRIVSIEDSDGHKGSDIRVFAEIVSVKD